MPNLGVGVEPISVFLSAGRASYSFGAWLARATQKVVTLGNNSSTDIRVAMIIKTGEYGNDWATVGWFPIGAGQQVKYKVPASRLGTKLGIYARNQSGSITWRASDPYRFAVAIPNSGKVKETDRFFIDGSSGSAVLANSSRASRIEVITGDTFTVHPLRDTYTFGE
jgi:hypothetical protein